MQEGKNVHWRKNSHNSFLQIADKKIQFEDNSNKKIGITIHAIRWVLLLVFLFITFSISTLFLTGGSTYLTIMVGYSIIGFFTFFMGYFGWLIARSTIEMMNGRRSKKCGASYYITKKHK